MHKAVLGLTYSTANAAAVEEFVVLIDETDD